jgi:hypothetical protein
MKDHIRRTCGSPEHLLSRRAFLGSSAGLLAGGTAGLDFLGSPALANQLQKDQKRAILIFLSGGASQFETWDPKPGRPTGGPFQSIQTSVPGIRISELMPAMAQRLHKRTAIIRSLSCKNVEHAGAPVQALLRGERTDIGNLKTPSLGCMLARELAEPGSSVPEHVAFYTTYVGFNDNAQVDFAGFLGGRYQPINILNKLSPESTKLPAFLSDRDHIEREALRDQLGKSFLAGRERDATLVSHGAAYERVRGLMASDKLFDISREPEAVRQRYGHSLFGQQALAARRLIEAGVPFVRLNRGWWDAHGENFDIHAALVPDLDQTMSALLDDLELRGLLDHTLVVTFAEMGRTPTINTMRGRDHWGKCWSVTLSGCGIKGGVVYGSTNADGTDVAENKVTPAQFFATIFAALGIDYQKEYMAPDGRPVALTPSRTRPIQDVLA